MKTHIEALQSLTLDVEARNHPDALALLSFDSPIGRVHTKLPYGFPAASPAHFFLSPDDMERMPRKAYDLDKGNRPPIIEAMTRITDPVMGNIVIVALHPQRWNPNKDNADTWVRTILNAIEGALTHGYREESK